MSESPASRPIADGALTPASLRVSVVVPVFNPGEYLGPLLDSLDRQSLPPTEFEAIFVDDGSDDGTATALDDWAKSRTNVLVIHQENHGWPGQPRNAGLDRARGEYVYFVDQDDWLGDEALERMTTYGTTHSSDVVVGKMVGLDRVVPIALFERSVARAELGKTRLEDSQTPHKMFRRAFLEECALRFPEGPRRLEDHLFVTTAYLRAAVVSVYADYDCYFHIRRADAGNAAFRSYRPADYYSNLEEVLDVIDEHLDDGPAKDKYLERWIRTELVGRLRSREIRDLPPAERAAFYAEISRILQKRIPLSAVRSAFRRVRLAAVLARSATEAQFFAIDSRVQAMTMGAHAARDAVKVSLYDGARRVPVDETISQVLTRYAPASLVTAVVADLGADEALLPPTVTAVTRSGRDIVLRRTGRSNSYSGQEPMSLRGATVRMVSIAGVKESSVAANALTSWLARASRAARSAVRRITRRAAARLPSR